MSIIEDYRRRHEELMRNFKRIFPRLSSRVCPIARGVERHLANIGNLPIQVWPNQFETMSGFIQEQMGPTGLEDYHAALCLERIIHLIEGDTVYARCGGVENCDYCPNCFLFPGQGKGDGVWSFKMGKDGMADLPGKWRKGTKRIKNKISTDGGQENR